MSYRLKILHGSSYGLSNQMRKYFKKYKSKSTKIQKSPNMQKKKICKKKLKCINIKSTKSKKVQNFLILKFVLLLDV